MKAGEVRFQQLLNGKIQYRVPLFQRTYSWNQEQWEKLWDDILEIYMLDKPRNHFIGAIVTLPIHDAPERAAKFILIDGQQRLTTLLLLLAVIRKKAERMDLKSLAAQITEECLINKFATLEEERIKLLPTKRDRLPFWTAILVQTPDDDTQIGAVWRFFEKVIEDGDLFGKPIELPKLKVRVTDYLDLVSITLDPDDSPHRIFESLNNTGMRLGPSDLIRNYLFMRIPDEQRQQETYDSAWFPMQEGLGDHLDAFFWRYLMKDGALIRWEETYSQMQTVVEGDRKLDNSQIPDFLRELGIYSSYYRRLIWPDKHEQNTVLREHLSHLNSWEVEVAYPFLLNIFHTLASGRITADEVAHVLSMIESFVVRRTVCGIPTNRLRYIFANMSPSIDAASYVESSREYLLRNEWPGDAEFRDKFQTFRLYIPGRLARTRLVLGALERSFGHKEPIELKETITIEHIMPQTLNEQWRKMLGERAVEIYGQWLHTVGNLTLSGYNPDMGNQSFEEKKKVLRESHIELTRDIVECEVWNESTIKVRGAMLADRAVVVWKRE
jgi:uncharacterized protein with ParB-like and HNH nuclease domain